MKIKTSLQNFLNACSEAGMSLLQVDASSLQPATVLVTPPSQWRKLAETAKTNNVRWCSFWAREIDSGLEVFSCYELNGSYLVIRSRINPDETLLSLATVYPAADRPERHAHDLLGIKFDDQPDNRRWTRHQAWDEMQYPLRAAFQSTGSSEMSAADDQYPFITAHGPGVMEIPVGPVHAGIIEPGHFRFQAVGEIVLNIEERLGYVHKGIEKIAIGRDAHDLARLAGRISGDSTVAHTWAACQAMERATGLNIPSRALWLRAVMAERERIANHLGDIGAICNDVGFVFAQSQLTRLKEIWIRENRNIFGHRLLMDCIIPGGTAVDVSPSSTHEISESCRLLAAEVELIIKLLEDSESLEDRLMGTGRLTPEKANELGTVGYVGRASGQAFDVRRDVAYAPYDRLDIPVPCFRAGDVAARAKIRAEEIRISAKILNDLLETLPDGPHLAQWKNPDHVCEGMGFIEGWRGEIMTYICFGKDGHVTRFFPRDPSWLNWPALEILMQDNIVPDFPVCNKSVNGSYSGHDL